MASAMGSPSRIFFIVSLAVLSLFWPDALRAEKAAALPDYVIKEFGKPPAVPEGPLSAALQSAVQVAFINSMQKNTWGRDQVLALDETAGAKDPRIAWIITDLMRFISAPELSAILANTAAKLLGLKAQNKIHWGIVTDHLIAWDIPALPDYLAAKRAIFRELYTVVPK